MAEAEGENARLHRALADCRDELASVRNRQEEWLEDLSQERRRRAQLERKLRTLSNAVDQLLTRTETPSRTRAALGRGTRTRAERRDVASILASGLFDGPWYVLQYPDIVLTGLAPAVHYLRVGAAKGYDPGPQFSTTRYFEDHPELRRIGVNPLLHHLGARRDAEDEQPPVARPST